LAFGGLSHENRGWKRLLLLLIEGMKEIFVAKITASEVLPTRAKVLRPHHPLMDAVFDGDQGILAAHFGAGTEAREILSVGSIYPEAFPEASLALLASPSGTESGVEFWRLRGMATDETARGKGLGTKILQSCIEYVRAKRAGPNTVIWAHARIGALKFYQQNGFRTVGPEYDILGIGPHYLIVMKL
jgi:GNAT superfamily N-acetyltransferase